MIVDGLKGGPCRLLKTNLDKDIDPKLSKYIVKQNKVIVKLKKVLLYDVHGKAVACIKNFNPVAHLHILQFFFLRWLLVKCVYSPPISLFSLAADKKWNVVRLLDRFD